MDARGSRYSVERVRKGPPSCATLGRVVRTESFHCAIQESSKRLYHERLLCKAGSTKAALAVGVFVNRYLEMDSRAFFQWTEAAEGRSSTRASGYHVPRVLRLISKPGERDSAPGPTVKISSPGVERREDRRKYFSPFPF